MAAKLLIAPETHADLDDAFVWYENRRAGLGMEFLSHVADRLQGILQTPTMHERVHADYRRALLHRFPYMIIYEYDGDYVTLYAVLHTARDSAEWQRRLV
jgi:plasmid stabilization system protein ParE